MMKWLSVAAGVAVALGSSQAMACGDFFGTSVLEKREITLHTLWDASFSIESARLIEAPKNLKWTAWRSESDDAIPADEQAAQLRARTLTTTQLVEYDSRVQDGDNDKSASLSDTLADYALGVYHYRDSRFNDAAQSFERAAAGLSSVKEPWPLVAAYMVGRSHLAEGNNAAAAAAFEVVTARSQKGEADPLSLGARSLSEAATAYQRAGEWVPAIKLQMLQAALELPGADTSLRWRVEAALIDDRSMTALLADSITRDAIVLYALAYLPAAGKDGWSLSRHGLSWDEYDELSDEQRAALPERLTSQDFMAAIVQALKGVKPDSLRGADRLAALYYRQGRYEEAGPFAEISQTPLAFWVGAKLALRDGDRERARDMYSKSIAAFPTLEDWGNDSLETSMARIPACRTSAEAAILTLQNGDVVDSLELFLRAGAVYWNDTAYLAERVLTVEELIALVDRLPSLTIAPSVRMVPESLDELELYERRGEMVEDPRKALSNLLARRLMRADRHDEAISRFTEPALKAKAKTYKTLIVQVDEQVGIARAKTLFEAAAIARKEGMQLLAFESSPDWAVHGGQYARPSMLEKLAGYQFKEDESNFWEFGDDDAWISQAERERVSQHSGQSTPRFTYRLTAAELANRAADDLPPDSQAFAAVLCHATSWLLVREPAMARKYYRRYQADGKRQGWAGEFGRTCPAPEWPMPA